jgi:hypothetical protein
LPLQAVDVQDDLRAGEPRHQRERRVGVVADERDVESAEQAIDDGDGRVADRVEVLVADGGQDPESHAAILAQPRLGHVRAAVHGDEMASLGKAHPELLGERLEAAIASGNAARSHDRDAHVSRGCHARRWRRWRRRPRQPGIALDEDRSGV